MKHGDKVTCVHAPETGIPLKEGSTYTINEYGPPPSNMVDNPARLNEPSVTLVEVPGLFRADRFEAA